MVMSVFIDKTVTVPCPDVELAAVDDGGELKHDGKPRLHPHTVWVSGVFFTRDKQL